MFGQHLLGGNMPLAVQHALGHHALPFTKQVRQNALIADVHHPAGVIQLKAHVESLRVALQGARLNVAPHPQPLTGMGQRPGFRFTVDNFPRGVEQIDIATQGVQRQADG